MEAVVVKTTTCTVPVLLLAMLGAFRAEASNQVPDVQLGVVRAYLAARTATMQGGATPGDVEKTLSFCTPSIVYEHPRVGIRLEGVDSLRSGMVDFLGSSRNASIAIVATLQGADMVAVRTNVAFEGQNGTSWEPVKRTQTWVFELEGSSIKRIIEYW